MIEKNYAGLDGFVWWMGVVESRQDPMGLGRCRVRIFGWHSASLSDIPSEHLPWAHPVFQAGNPAFSTPKESEMVFGFFADGRNAQVPMIMGIIPHYAVDQADGNNGFNDVRPLDTIKVAPKKVVSRTYKTDGTGITIGEANTANTEVLESLRHPTAKEMNKPSITGLARNSLVTDHVIYSRRTKGSVFIKTANSMRFKEPNPAYSPKYPYNNAFESESGHSLEFDDTPGDERVTLAHRSGSFMEYYPTGTKVEEITKNNFKIVMSDDHVHIMGKAFVTIDSDVYIRSAGDIYLESGNDLNVKVSGQMNLSVGEELNVRAKTFNLQTEDNCTLYSGGSQYFTSSGSTNIKGSSVSIGASSSLNMKAGGSGNMEAGGSLNLKGTSARLGGVSVDIFGAGSARLDGGSVSIKKGAAMASGASSASAGSPAGIAAPDPRSTKNDNPPFIDNGASEFELLSVDDDFEKPEEEINAILESNGLPPVNTKTPEEGESTTPNAGGKIVAASCGNIMLLEDYSQVKLSKNFTLSQFTQGGTRKLQDQFGLSASDILCNLYKLCNNVLEPLKDQGINFRINSGFRRVGDVPQSSSKSDHYFGRAVDIVVSGMSQFEAANKIYPIVGGITKQFLLEYQGSTGAGWIHLAYDDGKKHGLPMATFNNHNVYARNKFVNLRYS